MKKVRNVLLVVCVAIILISGIDFVLAANNKKPVFACMLKKSEIKKDGGSMTCYGVGYYVDIISEIDADKGPNHKVDYHIGFKK